MKKINIAFMIDYLDIGGTERQLYALVSQLDKNQFEPVVFCFKEKGKFAYDIEKLGIPVILLNRFSFYPFKGVRRFLQILQLVRLLRLYQIDITQTYLLTANIFGTIASVFAGVKIICASERNVINTDHIDFPRRNRLFRWLVRWIDVVFGNSQQVAEYLKKEVKIPEAKVRCIYNGISPDQFQFGKTYNLHQELGIPADQKLVGMIARLVSAKNHSHLFEVVSLVRQQYQDFHVILIGEGPCRKALEKEAGEMGLSPNIHFLGNRLDIPELLSALDIVVSSSKFEGLPNAVMEAMAAGKPVVATNAGGTKELIVDQETGFLVPVNDVYHFATKLSSLLKDEQLVHEMGRRGMKHIHQNFSVEQLVKSTTSMYLLLMAQHEKRPQSVFRYFKKHIFRAQ